MSNAQNWSNWIEWPGEKPTPKPGDAEQTKFGTMVIDAVEIKQSHERRREVRVATSFYPVVK